MVMKRGFTLVEMLVYLAIFLVITTASVTFLISLDDFVDQYRLDTMLYRSGTSVMEQVLLAARQADQVDVLNTFTASSTAGRVEFENTATTTAFEIDYIAGNLNLTINGVDLGNLVHEDVTVTGFTVYRYDVAQGEMVRVKLELEATVGSAIKTATFYGGSVIRGSI